MREPSPTSVPQSVLSVVTRGSSTRLRPGVDAVSAQTQVKRLLDELARGQGPDHRLVRMTPRLLLGLRLPREARRRTEATLAMFAGIVGVEVESKAVPATLPSSIPEGSRSSSRN